MAQYVSIPDITSLQNLQIRGFKSSAAFGGVNGTGPSATSLTSFKSAVPSETLGAQVSFGSASAAVSSQRSISPDDDSSVSAKRRRLEDDEDNDSDTPQPPPKDMSAMSPAEAKRWKRVMANRRSAKESRERKKRRLVELEETVTRLDAQRNELERENGALRAQVDALTQLHSQSNRPAVPAAASPQLALPGTTAVSGLPPALQSRLLLLQQARQRTAAAAAAAAAAAQTTNIRHNQLQAQAQAQVAAAAPQALPTMPLAAAATVGGQGNGQRNSIIASLLANAQGQLP